MTSKKVAAPAEPNYRRVDLEPGVILTNEAGTRKIQIRKSFARLGTRTSAKVVYTYSVFTKTGEIDYNDQKTFNQLIRCFPVKVA